MNQDNLNQQPQRIPNDSHSGVAHVSRPQSANRVVQEIVPPAEASAPVQTVAAESTSATPAAAVGFVLPGNVVSRSDVARSLRELETIDDYFHQAAIRGSKDQSMPTLGKVLDSLAVANNLNMLNPEDRAHLKSFLSKVKLNAPVIHMSFPSEASGPFLSKILEWFRQEVHPHTVLHVGLQPELVAGCMLRTTNKIFDFSFRKKFEKSKEKLIAALESSPSVASTNQQPPPNEPVAELDNTNVAERQPVAEASP